MPNAVTGPTRVDVLHHGRPAMILHWIVIASVCPIQPECPMLYLGLLDTMYCTMDDLCLSIQCCHDIALDRDCVCVSYSTRMSNTVSGPARYYVLHHGRSVSEYPVLS